MYQKSGVGNMRYFTFNNERKEDIFFALCQIHNINH